MDVIIVGSGICGLTAAIGLRKAGHRVKIFEKTHTATAFGAGVVLGHNPMAVLTAYEIDYEAARTTRSKDLKVYNGANLELVNTVPMVDPEFTTDLAKNQYFAHRVDLQQELLRLAAEPGRSGLPVEITYNSPVVSYSENGSVTLENGTTHSADLVVAADGVYSVAPRYIVGRDFDPKFTGTSIVRFMLPTDSIKSDPSTQDLDEGDGHCYCYVSADHQRYMLRYPVRDNTLQNFGLYSINKEVVAIDDQTHRFQCDRESLARELEGFHESILAIVPKTTEILPVWKLVERPPMPTWYCGKLLAIGDAAHPMLPNQGQGAAMAVEDAGALGVIFSDLPNTSSDLIAERLALFERVRRGRASVLQLLSSIPFFENAMTQQLPQLLEYLPRDKLPKSGDPADLRQWMFKYDVMEESRRSLNDHLRGKSSMVNN